MPSFLHVPPFLLSPYDNVDNVILTADDHGGLAPAPAFVTLTEQFIKNNTNWNPVTNDIMKFHSGNSTVSVPF